MVGSLASSRARSRPWHPRHENERPVLYPRPLHPKMINSLKIPVLAAALLVIGSSAIPAFATGTTTETFDFVGACSDCSGNGTGTLELTGGYVQGSAITVSNFVSFTYNGTDLFGPFTILAGAPGLHASGSIPSVLPAVATVSISDADFYFDSSVDGLNVGVRK